MVRLPRFTGAIGEAIEVDDITCGGGEDGEDVDEAVRCASEAKSESAAAAAAAAAEVGRRAKAHASLAAALLPRLADFTGAGGAILLVYALLLTRGKDAVRRDMSAETGVVS